jgi:hypothetical protein
MEIHIEPAARERIINKAPHGAVTIIVSERPGSCCNSAACYLFVQLGRPEHLNDYQKSVVDDVEVYYHNRVARFFLMLTLKIESFLFLQNIVVSGQ